LSVKPGHLTFVERSRHIDKTGHYYYQTQEG